MNLSFITFKIVNFIQPMCALMLHFLMLCTLTMFSSVMHAAEIEPAVLTLFSQGQTPTLIVEYDDSLMNQRLMDARLKKRRIADSDDELVMKRRGYAAIKNHSKALELQAGIEQVRDYDHLPISLKRFKTVNAVRALLASGNVKAVYADSVMHKVLAQSLPLIQQPAVSQVQYQGAGATVVVIDDGIDLTKAAFGPCSAVATPAATCRVVVANTIVNSGTANSLPEHGSNVAATVLGVAPKANIAAINVFNNTGGAFASDIISAINWAIANRAIYNIVAINMSLGGGDRNTSVCPMTPFTSPVQRAKEAGINVVVASGNEGYLDGLSTPACVPAALSVGAVYDSNVGGITYSSCADATTAADQVTCFSNSAPYLNLLAPGALVTSAGITMAGTSQAAPHVAGAVAVLRAAFVNETAEQIQARLISVGKAVTDSRNNIVKPRLDLRASARPSNDAFANPVLMSGASGSVNGTNLLATAEVGEPAHAELPAQHSVWMQWTAPEAGQVTLSVSGSLSVPGLAVYTGASINTLTPKAMSNNANVPLYFQAAAGTTYHIAINGNANNAGNYQLDWTLNPSADANLAVSLSGPSQPPVVGTPYFYTLSVTNAGPANAINVAVQLTLPSGASLISADPRCQSSNQQLTCRLSQLDVAEVSHLNLELVWNTLVNQPPLVISVSSDVADADSSNNISTFNLPMPPTSAVTDVPTLPQWGLIIMACMLMLLNRRHLKAH